MSFKPGMHQLCEGKRVDFDAIVAKMAGAQPQVTYPMLGWGKKFFIKATVARKTGDKTEIEFYVEMTFPGEPGDRSLGYTREDATLFQGVQILEFEKTGREIPWKNPATNSTGMIKIERTYYETPKLPCRAYRRTQILDEGLTMVVEGTGCRVGDARWFLDEKPPTVEGGAPSKAAAPPVTEPAAPAGTPPPPTPSASPSPSPSPSPGDRRG